MALHAAESPSGFSDTDGGPNSYYQFRLLLPLLQGGESSRIIQCRKTGMRISENVKIAGGIAHKAPEILKAIERGDRPGYKVWYGITTAWEQENLMYIISSMEYRLPVYHDDSLRLLGLAGSRQEAGQLVLEIVKNGYDKDAMRDMKHFLEEF